MLWVEDIFGATKSQGKDSLNGSLGVIKDKSWKIFHNTDCVGYNRRLYF
jgi:hypothetical protein